jgi:hypothetical protein
MTALLTVEEAAEILRLTPEDVHRLLTRDELWGVELSPGVWRIAQADLRKFILVRRRGFVAGPRTAAARS